MLYYKAGEGFIHRKIVNDDFLIPCGEQVINRNGLAMMNETAALLWNELQSEKTTDELCAALAGQYDITAENAAQDVESFIEKMTELGAVTVTERN